MKPNLKERLYTWGDLVDTPKGRGMVTVIMGDNGRWRYGVRLADDRMKWVWEEEVEKVGELKDEDREQGPA